MRVFLLSGIIVPFFPDNELFFSYLLASVPKMDAFLHRDMFFSDLLETSHKLCADKFIPA
jgi:hypothetical protein